MMPAHSLNLETRLGPLRLRSPIVLASGTWGYGTEGADFIDYSKIGALVMKGITLQPRRGNPGPRIHETSSGILNSVGLENVGIDDLLKSKLPAVSNLPCAVIANFSGYEIDEYPQMARMLNGARRLDAIEANLSCPNVKAGGKVWATDAELVHTITRSIRSAAPDKPLFIKLSPNVTDIRPIADAAIRGGADGLTIANCLLGIAIDPTKRQPVFRNSVAGMSGPAVKPIILRLVWEVATEFSGFPVIGLGGVFRGVDVAEYLIAGAQAVGVGSASLAFPDAAMRIHREFSEYCSTHGITTAKELYRNAIEGESNR